MKEKSHSKYKKHITGKLISILIVMQILLAIVLGVAMVYALAQILNGYAEDYQTLTDILAYEYSVDDLDEYATSGVKNQGLKSTEERLDYYLESVFYGRAFSFFVLKTDDGINYDYVSYVGDEDIHAGEPYPISVTSNKSDTGFFKEIFDAGDYENLSYRGENNTYYEDGSCFCYLELENGRKTNVSFHVEQGEHVYYLCVDMGGGDEGGGEVLTEDIRSLGRGVIVLLLLLFIISYVFMFLLVSRSIVRPIQRLKKAAGDFSALTKENLDPREWVYDVPDIKTDDELMSLADTVADMAENMKQTTITLLEESKNRERLSAELSLATSIQKNALKTEFPAFPDREDFDIYASMTPAKEVGGDFYDFFMVDDDHLVFLIADVSSKGVPAALFMMRAKTMLRSGLEYSDRIDRVFSLVNNRLCENNDEDMFVTCWMALVELSTGRLSYVNAGHDPALLAREGRVEKIPMKPGMVLASFEDFDYEYETLKLNHGDRIFLYTDGLNEAQTAEGDLYGMDRLMASVAACSHMTAGECENHVIGDMEKFVGDAPQFDDVTVLVFDYK